ncbi:MAG: hypothetical protein CNCCGFBP_00002 [Fimbriimonadaceae bacterium]|nr:hypothetical protein [Fimbriimonadaceae bacterium]
MVSPAGGWGFVQLNLGATPHLLWGADRRVNLGPNEAGLRATQSGCHPKLALGCWPPVGTGLVSGLL